MNKNKLINSPIGIDRSGWKKVLKRVMERIVEDNIPIVSAGVAFYAFLAIFPGIMALFSIYGLATDAQSAQEQITRLAEVMPEEAISLIEGRVNNLMETSATALGWGTLFGILIALWSANRGIKSLFTGLDIAYSVENGRGFIKQYAVTLAFTLATIVVIIVSLAFIVLFPVLVNTIGFPETVGSLITWLRWPVLAIIVITAISLIYQHGPSRETPGFQWVVLGATMSTIVWLIASWGFSVYVSNFGNYGEMYGSLSAVVILLFWLFITSFIILLGGELNRATEAYANNRLEPSD
ncbi:YihY/virulence factor BrkB family protein [Rhodohalobacter sp. SW132]|uniref:YihY/virulence factor BrkB family protein n=1 Tax=Rhodohalobacter sp. SW132 TaxID=2293433 RepID=UPI000E26B5DF|nr:YihY/virulence factor BrkB family protein [Rhodohalobacter sp. SW132]REL37997.1 YihY/virulence factor BrkB family protein [Rhodohalobacter sp. SW132]